MLTVALLAGCGSSRGGQPPPTLERADAARLASLSDRIARDAGDGCAYGRDAVRLRAETTRLINAGRVPQLLQEPLSSAVNDIAARAPLCAPPAAATTAEPSDQAQRTSGKRSGKHDRTHKPHGEKHG